MTSEPSPFDGDRRLKAEEWADYLQAKADGKKLYDERRRGTPDEPTWAPVDMREALSKARVLPTVGRRCDGRYLFYPGLVNGIHAESESGKSWFALFVVAQELIAGRPVLYADYEDNATNIGHRLHALGVPHNALGDKTKFMYVNPLAAPDNDIEQEEFSALLECWYTVAVIDGVTEAMKIAGLNPNDGGDVAEWQLGLPRKIAKHTNAAVIVIDHDTKDHDKRTRGPIGSERKLSGLDGASYTVRVGKEPFVEGSVGCIQIRVDKDRPGTVRAFGTDYDPKDRTHLVAHFELDSTGDTLEARLITPTTPPPDEAEGEADARRRRYCCWFMEEVSRWFEDLVPQGEERTKQQVINAKCLERKEAGKKQSRDWWRDAINFLLDEGFLDGPTDIPTGKPCPLKFVKPYRQCDDPKSDKSAAGNEGSKA